jgi:hypothetical protein
VSRGNSPRITAGVAELALATADDFEHYLRSADVVDMEGLRIARQLRELAAKADIADYTLGVLLSGMRESGVMGERFWRMMQDLRRHQQRQEDGPTGPATPARKIAA